MRKTAIVLLCIIFLNPTVAMAEHIKIREGTEVLLKLITPLHSKDVSKGQTVELMAEMSVRDENGVVLIEEKAPAYGTVTAAQKAGAFGAKGKLDFTVDRVTGLSGVPIPLRAQQSREGGGNEALAVAGFLFVSIFAGFIRGENVSIPSGTLLKVFVDKTTILSEDINMMEEQGFGGGLETDQKLNELLRQIEEKDLSDTHRSKDGVFSGGTFNFT